jgi:hypothetical protein
VEASAIVGIVGIGVSAATGLGGVWLGSVRATKTARQMAMDEREWSAGQRVRERQEFAAAVLDEGLIELMKGIPQGSVRSGDAREALGKAFEQLRELWSRAPVLNQEEEVKQRYYTLDTLLFMACQESTGNADAQLMLWPLKVALDDLRDALRAFLLHREPDPTDLPQSAEVIQLGKGEDKWLGLTGVNNYLIDHKLHDFKD